jgi:putative membrane protein
VTGGGLADALSRPPDTMIDVQDLSHVIALLNGASAFALGLGFFFIRRGRWRRHRACMLTAVGLSAAFLVVYVIYKANAGFARFGGEGWIRPVYFTILIAHIMGAVAIVPLVPIALVRALRGRFDAHRRIARLAWPLWMYVGVSGVVVYAMAVHLFPHPHG